jgi:5-methylcytosine-specific restriction protein A
MANPQATTAQPQAPESSMPPRLRCAPSRLKPANQYAAKPPEKTREAFYGSPEFREWRAAVFTRAGGRCEWPGCTKSKAKGDRMYADHIHERKHGGADLDPVNGQCLCHAHHEAKRAIARKQWLEEGIGG